MRRGRRDAARPAGGTPALHRFSYAHAMRRAVIVVFLAACSTAMTSGGETFVIGSGGHELP